MIRKNFKKAKKHAAALIIGTAIFVICLLAYHSGFLDFLEYRAYDFRVRLLAGSTKPSEDIIVVLLNQDSIDWAQAERGWSWPWPRKAYAEFVDYMNLANAASVSFDVIFSEPSVYGREDDEAFAKASAEYGRVVQTVFFSTQSGTAGSWPADLRSPLFSLDNFGSILGNFDLSAGNSGKRVGAQFPIPDLRNSAGVIGNVTGKADADGYFRRAPLFINFDGKAVPGLSAAALLASGWDPAISYNPGGREIRWGDYFIPVDKQGRALLRFRGDLDRYIPYSAADILKSAGDLAAGKEALLAPENFEGKHVFFGFYAPGLFDVCTTPISSVYPGVGMHITMMDNILQQDFINPPSNLFALIMLIIISGLTCFSTLYTKRISHAIAGLLGIIIAVIACALGAYVIGFWIPMIAPLFAALLCFLSGTLYNYATEGKQRKFIKSAFGQYLSPILVEKLMANPELLRLGGERRELTMFFSDIQGFTSISEKMEPTHLTELINKYLSFLTEIIQDSGGYVDKYIGDAIVAFWNAPLDQDDHASRGLRSALECQKQLSERQAVFEKEYGFRLITRIGLNTGYAIVGNMGSETRFNYTMLGDSVNLAARLEGLNKQFGTHTMCTKTCFDKANLEGPFYGRTLAKVAVVGKDEAIPVLEPMLQEVYESKKDIIARFDAARDLFYAGKFPEALKLFEALKDIDPPAYYYAEQCRYYLDNASEWQGFWKAASK